MSYETPARMPAMGQAPEPPRAASEVRAEMRREVATRAAYALLLAAALLPAFTLADVLFLQRRAVVALTFLKIGQAALMLVLYLALRRNALRPLAVIMIALVTGALAAGATSSFTGDVAFIPLLASLLMLLTALTFPWGLWPQLGTACIWTSATVWNMVYVTGSLLASAYPFIIVTVIGVASVVLAHKTYQNRIVMAETDAARREEAYISACLARIGEELIACVDTQVLMDRLCELSAEVLGCDSSHTWARDPSDDCYSPVSVHGETSEAREFLRMIRIPATIISDLLAKLGRERIVELSPATTDEVFPPTIAAQIRSTGVERFVYVALRRGDELFGIQSLGYRHRSAPLSPMQRRLAAGIAHLGSMALERTRLIEELNHTNRVKDHFVATMSHEIRNPLGVIIGYSELLLGQTELGPLTESQRETIARIQASARQVLAVIEVALDMSRFERRDVAVDIRDVDVSLLFEELANDARVQTTAGDIPLIWDVEPCLPVLKTDPVKLRMVLRNLIENALKFTQRGEIHVAARTRGDGVELSVRDSGIGIPANARDLIFEPFRRLDSGRPDRGGAGLGLYIVQRLAKLLGATIEVESELGVGSTFRVWLPRDSRDTGSPIQSSA